MFNIFYAIIAVCGLAGLLFLILAARRLRQWRLLAGGVHALAGACFLLAAAAAWMLGFSVLTYERLTHEQPAAEVMLSRLGERHYRATLTYPSGRTQSFELRGDEWQVDARVLKWRGLANIAGFDTVYRLERIGGRYRDIKSERAEPRTVHVLREPARVDAWELARRYHAYVPWVDALAGSAAFLPMADGALFEVRVSQSGLIARPLNQAGRDAVAGWR
ncbi:MAG: hypothetical protein A3I02_11345 [Betaproteobacteria bacterium RIFCSPLOWO2_02_FULL_67_26]|nr:MAG: hypothetical protein A3I02_11345 [Betaproteobacteria bacterium RIFCSPLOWO2_02_FULL_67_26]